MDEILYDKLTDSFLITNYQTSEGTKSQNDYLVGKDFIFMKPKNSNIWTDISNNKFAGLNLRNFVRKNRASVKQSQNGNLIEINDFEFEGKKSNFDFKILGDLIFYRWKGYDGQWVDISDNQEARNNLSEFRQLKAISTPQPVVSEKPKDDNKKSTLENKYVQEYVKPNTSVQDGTYLATRQADKSKHSITPSEKLTDASLAFIEQALKEKDDNKKSTLENKYVQEYTKPNVSVQDRTYFPTQQIDKSKRFTPSEELADASLAFVKQALKEKANNPSSTESDEKLNTDEVNLTAEDLKKLDKFRSNISKLQHGITSAGIAFPLFFPQALMLDIPLLYLKNNPPDVLREIIIGKPNELSWKDYMTDLAKNYIARKALKSVENVIVDPISYDSDKYIINMTGGSYINTTKDNASERYKLSNNVDLMLSNLDISNFKFGYRNRDNNTPIKNIQSIPVTTVEPFTKKAEFIERMKNPKIAKNGLSIIGITKNGELKVGTSVDEFSSDDVLTNTYSYIIDEFLRNPNGTVKTIMDPQQNQFHVPLIRYLDEKTGLYKEGRLNLFAGNKASGYSTNAYDNLAGGKVIFKIGNGETRLVSGSILNIADTFDQIKLQHPNELIRAFVLDNGSYSRAFKFKNNNGMSSKELQKYHGFNNGGGTFAYVISKNSPKLLYRSDTLTRGDGVLPANFTGVVYDADTTNSGMPAYRNPRGIVLHLTATPITNNDYKAVTDAFTRGNLNPKDDVGANVIILPNGNRTVLADPRMVTYHAGKSSYTLNGEKLVNLNDFFAGIEVVGLMNDLVTPNQIKSIVEYVKPIIQEYQIPLEAIVTHKQIRDDYIATYGNDNGKIQEKWDMNQASFNRVIQAIIDNCYVEKDSKFDKDFQEFLSKNSSLLENVSIEDLAKIKTYYKQYSKNNKLKSRFPQNIKDSVVFKSGGKLIKKYKK